MYQYVHGGDIYSDPSLKQNKEMLDYSANINPLGIPAGVCRALKNAVADSVNYPDAFCRELRAGLSRYFSLPAEMIRFPLRPDPQISAENWSVSIR